MTDQDSLRHPQWKITLLLIVFPERKLPKWCVHSVSMRLYNFPLDRPYMILLNPQSLILFVHLCCLMTYQWESFILTYTHCCEKVSATFPHAHTHTRLNNVCLNALLWLFKLPSSAGMAAYCKLLQLLHGSPMHGHRGQSITHFAMIMVWRSMESGNETDMMMGEDNIKPEGRKNIYTPCLVQHTFL